MKKHVGLWIRVSTDEQAEGDSPKHHEQRGRMYAELQDWQVVEVYHLEAVSGKSVINHPEAQRMLNDVREGHITGLVFSKLARLARNTKELLDIADIFKEHDADLVSLQEKIDTSSPAGRLFYTLIAAMAEWERAEIASRVAASIPIRAKMGKPLGGKSPFGYKLENKELALDENEAPVRKLMYELFAEHKRKRKVANILNERGYRTRNGGKFSDTTVHRLLRDPIAKGMRRVNYTQSLGENKKWKLKPKEDWVFVEAPRIIPDELWNTCNTILDDMSKSRKKVRGKGVHLFSTVLQCECGDRMYMRTQSPKYVCKAKGCKNKIDPKDLEAIYHEQLKSFLFSDLEIQKHINQKQIEIEDKKKLLKVLEQDCKKLKEKENSIFDLYHEGQIEKHSFKDHHEPIYTKLKQKKQERDELQASIDALELKTLNSDQVLHDARDLHKQWHKFSKQDKKTIIETITDSIIVGKEDIAINLSYIPTQVTNEETPANTYTNLRTNHIPTVMPRISRGIVK